MKNIIIIFIIQFFLFCNINIEYGFALAPANQFKKVVSAGKNIKMQSGKKLKQQNTNEPNFEKLEKQDYSSYAENRAKGSIVLKGGLIFTAVICLLIGFAGFIVGLLAASNVFVFAYAWICWPVCGIGFLICFLSILGIILCELKIVDKEKCLEDVGSNEQYQIPNKIVTKTASSEGAEFFSLGQRPRGNNAKKKNITKKIFSKHVIDEDKLSEITDYEDDYDELSDVDIENDELSEITDTEEYDDELSEITEQSEEQIEITKKENPAKDEKDLKDIYLQEIKEIVNDSNTLDTHVSISTSKNQNKKVKTKTNSVVVKKKPLQLFEKKEKVLKGLNEKKKEIKEVKNIQKTEKIVIEEKVKVSKANNNNEQEIINNILFSVKNQNNNININDKSQKVKIYEEPYKKIVQEAKNNLKNIIYEYEDNKWIDNLFDEIWFKNYTNASDLEKDFSKLNEKVDKIKTSNFKQEIAKIYYMALISSKCFDKQYKISKKIITNDLKKTYYRYECYHQLLILYYPKNKKNIIQFFLKFYEKQSNLLNQEKKDNDVFKKFSNTKFYNEYIEKYFFLSFRDFFLDKYNIKYFKENKIFELFKKEEINKQDLDSIEKLKISKEDKSAYYYVLLQKVLNEKEVSDNILLTLISKAFVILENNWYKNFVGEKRGENITHISFLKIINACHSLKQNAKSINQLDIEKLSLIEYLICLKFKKQDKKLENNIKALSAHKIVEDFLKLYTLNKKFNNILNLNQEEEEINKVLKECYSICKEPKRKGDNFILNLFLKQIGLDKNIEEIKKYFTQNYRQPEEKLDKIKNRVNVFCYLQNKINKQSLQKKELTLKTIKGINNILNRDRKNNISKVEKSISSYKKHIKKFENYIKTVKDAVSAIKSKEILEYEKLNNIISVISEMKSKNLLPEDMDFLLKQLQEKQGNEVQVYAVSNKIQQTQNRIKMLNIKNFAKNMQYNFEKIKATFRNLKKDNVNEIPKPEVLKDKKAFHHGIYSLLTYNDNNNISNNIDDFLKMYFFNKEEGLSVSFNESIKKLINFILTKKGIDIEGGASTNVTLDKINNIELFEKIFKMACEEDVKGILKNIVTLKKLDDSSFMILLSESKECIYVNKEKNIVYAGKFLENEKKCLNLKGVFFKGKALSSIGEIKKFIFLKDQNNISFFNGNNLKIVTQVENYKIKSLQDKLNIIKKISLKDNNINNYKFILNILIDKKFLDDFKENSDKILSDLKEKIDKTQDKKDIVLFNILLQKLFNKSNNKEYIIFDSEKNVFSQYCFIQDDFIAFGILDEQTKTFNLNNIYYINQDGTIDKYKNKEKIKNMLKLDIFKNKIDWTTKELRDYLNIFNLNLNDIFDESIKFDDSEKYFESYFNYKLRLCEKTYKNDYMDSLFNVEDNLKHPYLKFNYDKEDKEYIKKEKYIFYELLKFKFLIEDAQNHEIIRSENFINFYVKSHFREELKLIYDSPCIKSIKNNDDILKRRVFLKKILSNLDKRYEYYYREGIFGGFIGGQNDDGVGGRINNYEAEKGISVIKGFKNGFRKEIVFSLLNEHSNIAVSENFVKKGKLWYLIIKKYNGLLSRSIKKFRGEDDVWDKMNDITCGLEYLHESHFVHGDLKIPNIFQKKEKGRVTNVIGDFGAPQINGCSINGTITSPELISPERAKGKIFFEYDIFSLGNVLVGIILGDKRWGVYKIMEEIEKKKYNIRNQKNLMDLMSKKYPGHYNSGMIREKLKQKIKDKIGNELFELIYKMLHPIPKERPSLKYIKEKFDKYKNAKKQVKAIFESKNKKDFINNIYKFNDFKLILKKDSFKQNQYNFNVDIEDIKEDDKTKIMKSSRELLAILRESEFTDKISLNEKLIKLLENLVIKSLKKDFKGDKRLKEKSIELIFSDDLDKNILGKYDKTNKEQIVLNKKLITHFSYDVIKEIILERQILEYIFLNSNNENRLEKELLDIEIFIKLYSQVKDADKLFVSYRSQFKNYINNIFEDEEQKNKFKNYEFGLIRYVKQNITILKKLLKKSKRRSVLKFLHVESKLQLLFNKKEIIEKYAYYETTVKYINRLFESPYPEYFIKRLKELSEKEIDYKNIFEGDLKKKILLLSDSKGKADCIEKILNLDKNTRTKVLNCLENMIRYFNGKDLKDVKNGLNYIKKSVDKSIDYIVQHKKTNKELIKNILTDNVSQSIVYKLSENILIDSAKGENSSLKLEFSDIDIDMKKNINVEDMAKLNPKKRKKALENLRLLLRCFDKSGIDSNNTIYRLLLNLLRSVSLDNKNKYDIKFVKSNVLINNNTLKGSNTITLSENVLKYFSADVINNIIIEKEKIRIELQNNNNELSNNIDISAEKDINKNFAILENIIKKDENVNFRMLQFKTIVELLLKLKKKYILDNYYKELNIYICDTYKDDEDYKNNLLSYLKQEKEICNILKKLKNKNLQGIFKSVKINENSKSIKINCSNDIKDKVKKIALISACLTAA